MAAEDPCDHLIDHSHVSGFEVRQALKIALTALYALILLAGIIGNCVTIRATKVLRDKGYLQKGVTDHMMSLACSDLLVLLLGMPVELYSVIWFPLSSAYGNVTCKVYCFLFEACSYATVLHVATLSLERYLAICHPFRFQVVSGPRAAKLMISFAWVTSVCVALPLIFAMGAEYPLNPTMGYRRLSNCSRPSTYQLTRHENVTLCTNLSSKWTVFQSSIFSAFIVYILLLGSVAFMCRRMMVTLMASKKGLVTLKGEQGVLTKTSSTEAKAARKQTIVFLGLIVVTLAVCWMPNQILRIMAASIPKQDWSVSYLRVYMTLLPIADTFFYLSSVVNPLLYNISSKQFRSVFLQVLRCHLTIQHANKEKFLRSNLNSAKSSTNYQRPLILMSLRRKSSRKAAIDSHFSTFKSKPECSTQVEREEPQETSTLNGVCESKI